MASRKPSKAAATGKAATSKPRTRPDVSAKAHRALSPEPRPLTAKQERFIAEYLIDLNATQAAIRAGYSAHTAGAIGDENLRKPAISAAIKAAQEKTAKKLEITRERLLSELWNIVIADPRELIEFRFTCCRYCYGEGFRYQRTAGEVERDYEAYLQAVAEGGKAAPKGEFDPKGGIGWDPRKPPNPECPECFGEGYGGAKIRDTSKVSPQAASLYAGVKETKEGFEIKMHPKLDAAEKIARHLGIYEKDNEQQGGALGALLAQVSRSAVPVVQDLPDDDGG